MLPRIIRSARANRDIQVEWAYLLENGGVEVADRFLDAVENTTSFLLLTPYAGKRISFRSKGMTELRRFPVRLPFGMWIVLYMPTAKGITLLRVVHGMRHPDRLRP